MTDNIDTLKKVDDFAWTVLTILEWTIKKFRSIDISTPLLDAQLLLAHVLKVSRIKLYIDYDKPLTQHEKTLFRSFVKRRLNGEPVAYILNEKYWHTLHLYVDERVLIPRPETESLLDFVFDSVKYAKISPKLIYDFCTGSGCLAIALAKEYPNSLVVAIDISKEALTIAKKNAESNLVKNIQFIELDLEKVESYKNIFSYFGPADIIVANPPYITEKEWTNLDISVRNFEPKLALVAKNDGLQIGQCIFSNVLIYNLLKNDTSIFLMELAENQAQKIAKLENKQFPLNTDQSLFPVSEWFSLRDLEDKSRFLVYRTKFLSRVLP